MMTLYSGTTDPFSQRCRFVLFEKGMDFKIIDVDMLNNAEDISANNPYGIVPTLVERDLVLHEANIINEYIDERFPHPQLMSPDPVMRAKTRLFLHRFVLGNVVLGGLWSHVGLRLLSRLPQAGGTRAGLHRRSAPQRDHPHAKTHGPG